MACIYKHPHGSINVTELDAILNHNNKTFLFGDFNAKYPSWNPGRESSLKPKTDSVNFGTIRDTPPYKREVNALTRQIRIEINEHKNRTWKNLLSTLNTEDNSLYNLHKRITKKHTVIPPLPGPSGIAYSYFEKAEACKDTLEVTFQENAEPYRDDKIEEVESLVNHNFDNFNTHIPPLTSPLEVRVLIKEIT
ncbi:uncharacterized protein TNCV_2993071 [Trichonephila clavipes]|nr:uncharacterized protein TNCV_2993071 [Trichonephila clavipes]